MGNQGEGEGGIDRVREGDREKEELEGREGRGWGVKQRAGEGRRERGEEGGSGWEMEMGR